MSFGFQLLKTKIMGSMGKYSPIKLTIALTFLCNSRCKTCGIWKMYLENPEKFKMELTTEEWKKLFDEVGTSLAWVEFTGGEPTLRKDSSKIISYAYNKTGILAGGLTTNAVAPKRSLRVISDVLSNIPENKILNVGISLDGLPEIHNEIRGINGNFENAVSLFQDLKSIQDEHPNLRVHFAYTISRYNAGKFREFFEYMQGTYDISIKDITITIEHFTEYYNKHNEYTSNPYNDFKNLLINDIYYILKLSRKEEVPSYFEKVKQAFYQFYLKEIPKFISDPRRMVIPCVAGRYSAYIDPYGNVYPCTQWLVKLGNLREKTFRKIWHGEETRKIRNLITQEKCPNCWTPCEAQPSWVMNFGVLRGWW